MIFRNEAVPTARNKRRMWPYHPDLLRTPVPRYTSYPTAASFAPNVGAADHAAALEKVEGDVSLYLHIPFCREICWYCGCSTGGAGRRSQVERYLEALHREIALLGRLVPASARIRRIAFGGGSPNAIAPTDFVRLLIALTQAFRLTEPAISTELDPRAMTPEWGEILRRVGVKRASLGVQTFDPAVQQAIGRPQPVELIEHCTALLRQAGITSLNYDMMYGLPGQDRATLANSLERAVALGADRIALFGYAHVPDLRPQLAVAELPDQAERFAMAALGHDLIRAAGYDAIGFDHFARTSDPLAVTARAGMLRRNFQGFTDDQCENVIALGASAISSFPGLLVQNENSPQRYAALIEENTLAAARGICRSAEDRQLGATIERLLCRGEAALETMMSESALAELEPFLAAGLARLDGDRLTITSEGLPYARSIAAIFDPYRRTGNRQFSSAV